LRLVKISIRTLPILESGKETAMDAARQDLLEERSATRWCWAICGLIAIALLAIFFYVLLPFLFPID
jgi:hypothetical protein